MPSFEHLWIGASISRSGKFCAHRMATAVVPLKTHSSFGGGIGFSDSCLIFQEQHMESSKLKVVAEMRATKILRSLVAALTGVLVCLSPTVDGQQPAAQSSSPASATTATRASSSSRITVDASQQWIDT